MIGHWQTRWRGLSRREQVMVSSAAAVILLGLVFALAVEPAWRDRSRIREILPTLQSQQLEVMAMAAQARALRASGVGSEPVPSIVAAAERSLTRTAVGAKVVVQPGGGLSVQARGVASAALLSWVESFCRETRATVVTARIERTASAGLVDADIVFAPGGH